MPPEPTLAAAAVGRCADRCRYKSDCSRVLTTSNGEVMMAPHIPPAPPATKWRYPLGGMSFFFGLDASEEDRGEEEEEDAACCASIVRKSTWAPASPEAARRWSCGIERFVEDCVRAEGRMGEMVSVSPSPGLAVAGYGMVAACCCARNCYFLADFLEVSWHVNQGRVRSDVRWTGRKGQKCVGGLAFRGAL